MAPTDNPPSPEVSIRSLATGGFGVGSLPDGKVVFVPRTAPGDRVLVRVVKEKGSWARAEALEWLEKAPEHREAPCSRYQECDGCSIQHLPYGVQVAWKGRMVGDNLRRVGKLDAEDPEVVPAPVEFRYRNKVSFTLRRLPGGRVVAGFRELGHRGRILDVGPECLLPDEALARVWKGIREEWGANARRLPEGRELKLTLRLGEDGVGLLVRGGRGDGNAGSLVEAVPGLSSVWRESKEGKIRHLAGNPTIRLGWGEETLEVRGGGFLQVNREVGEVLFGYVLDQVGEVTGRSVVDAYCGMGILGRALARKKGDVVGIELDPEGVWASEQNPCEGFRIVQGRVERELKGLLPADLVILNPPRTGLDQQVTASLVQRRAERLIYVSCDPSTLARDLARMVGAYKVETVRSFDLFPQTSHVETVVTLRGITG